MVQNTYMYLVYFFIIQEKKHEFQKEKKIHSFFTLFYKYILHAFGPKAFVCVIIFVGSYSDSDLTNYTIRINIFCTIDIVNKMFNV